MLSFEHAHAFIAVLVGDPATAVLDFRALHPTDKGDLGHPHRGTLLGSWEWITTMNTRGLGIFVAVNELDGVGRSLENVTAVRAHFVDLDNAAAEVNLSRALQSEPPPSMVVRSSPGKAHVYWPVMGYRDNDRFQTLQRRLRQTYDSDPAVIDATRVMRLPGTINTKPDAAGHIVTVEAGPAWGQRYPVTTLEAAYGHIQVIEGGGGRHDLGDPSLAAPSMQWVEYALASIDPNMLDRATWVSTLAAAKQAAWSHATPEAIEAMLMEWCARYERNDVAENIKQIGSLRQTEVGWPALTHRAPGIKAQLAFGGQSQAGAPVAALPEPVAPPALDCSGEILTAEEQKQWFKGCVSVTKLGRILSPDGSLYDQKSFNIEYGGKLFIITTSGKTTDEAWKAATRSTMWTVPKAHHLRFLPHEPHGALVADELGRLGVNTYKPAHIKRVQGDPSMFLDHLARVIPDDGDRKILLDWMAHVVKFPGFKIPWAPVIQSVEGVGKNVIKRVMTHAIGSIYVHEPNSKELTSSGSQFNGWLRNKLFILADEIKVDDKRDLIEVLKPLISETSIEIQSKGIDQEREDCYAVWMFFTNYKDAVPVSKNGRRYAIFFSPIQTEADLTIAGMGETYFDGLYKWLNADGAAIVTDYLMSYDIEHGAIPMRAPKTTSWEEAVKIGRSPIERCISEAIQSGAPGFRGGWVSMITAMRRIREEGAARGNVPPHVISGILTGMGYVASGIAPRPFIQEDKDRRSELYHFGGAADVGGFGATQGWE